MKSTQFQIVIPAYNAVNLIDQTMQSIWQQRFDQENIYTVIVDFGSADGTYQKILHYDSFHLGVYQVGRDYAEDQMAAVAGRLAAYTQSAESCVILLWPGDIIYPTSLERVAKVMERYCHKGMIISETDVMARDGSIIRPPALYESERVIDGKTEYMEYLTRGYRHNVMCFGGRIGSGFKFTNGQINERIWWSKSVIANFERDAVYIPESLGCIQERYYEDELWEIMLRWSANMIFYRGFEGKYKRKVQESTSAEENLACYILWRSYLLAEKGDERQAKECFQFSTVCCPGIRETQIYRWLEKYVLEKDQYMFPRIQAYFQMDEQSQRIE